MFHCCAAQVSYCKADPKSIPKTVDPAAAVTAAAANAAATAHAASLSMGGQQHQQQQQFSSSSTAAASGNWKLDDDEGGAGVKMDSTNRANMMSRFGSAAAAGECKHKRVSCTHAVDFVSFRHWVFLSSDLDMVPGRSRTIALSLGEEW